MFGKKRRARRSLFIVRCVVNICDCGDSHVDSLFLFEGCEFLLRNDSRNVDCYRVTFFPKNQDRGVHGRLLRCIRVDY